MEGGCADRIQQGFTGVGNKSAIQPASEATKKAKVAVDQQG